MPLPVAVGGRAVSAETLPQANCREEDSDDGIPLIPVELYQTIGWGICPRNEWLVRVTAGYYDLMDFNKGARDCTMCELRIQVSFVAKPLASQYRETVHHLKLVDGARDDYPQFQPQVVVSQDRRNLAVLLFHPHQQSSAVVVFQLRRPRSDMTAKTNVSTSSSPMPMLAYCNKISSRPEAPAVATNPNFVSVWGISAMCSIPNVLPSVFLAICNDGSLIWLDARSSTTIATGALAISSENLPISSLSATAESLERGCILAVSSATGNCILAQWKLESSTAVQQTQLDRNSTGDLMVRSESSTNQQQQQHNSQDEMKYYHDSLETFNMGNVHQSNNNIENDNGMMETKHSTSKDMSTINSVNDKEGSHQAVRRLSSTKSDSHDGIQNAFKGLKSNRFWNSMAPKNLILPAVGGGMGNGSSGKSNNIPQNNSTTKEEILREQRERDIFEQESRQRKSHMNHFVLQELRKKTLTKSWVTHATGRVPERRMSLQRRRRRSDVAGQHEDPLRNTMHVDLLSVLEEFVVAAQFGRIPTVVCVVYKAMRRQPEVAKMFSISGKGTFHSIASLRLTSEQVEEATSLQATNAIVSDEDWDIKNSINTKFGLHLDVDSDTFAISTAFGDQWIGCLWNWRSNALGLVVQNEANSSLWSRLYFGNDKQEGLKLCYLDTCIQDLQIQTHKHLLTTGMLSPPNSRAIELEPCPLFLAADFVAFPYVSHETNNGAQQLEWKSSTLPLSYVNAYGAPRLAAVGRHNGSTIAIASFFGVCLLDSKYRWRQFGTPSEESSFSIISMVWWEGNGTRKLEENEDFLLTIIQLRNGKQYLSCWSPKRLGTSHQLLVSSSPDNDKETKWGIPLVKDVKASSLSLLAEPASRSKGAKGSRKAVAFVTSTDAEASELKYASFQLQLTTTVDNASEKRSISILTKKTISGIVRDGTRSVGPISSILLAGASFRFDLQDRSVLLIPENSLIATLGVSRSPGGFEVISFDAGNKAYTSTIRKSNEVSKISLVDVVHGGKRRIDTFVWAIELLNGEMFCWFVPSLLGFAVEQEDELYHKVPTLGQDIVKPSMLIPPIPVCKRERRSKIIRYAMGEVYHAGASSDWMQQSASGCQSDVFMGSSPRSSYGCGLRAGQSSRNTRRTALYDISGDNFVANIHLSESYGPSNFLLTPPAFVPSVYAMIVETAHRRTIGERQDESNALQELEDDSARMLNIERHIYNRLTTSQNKDAVTMALRLFVLRTVDVVTDVHKKHGKEQTEASESLLAVATTILSEVVDCVRKCATDLQFASLFLEVGRQMEPSCLPHLFPLPLSEQVVESSPPSRAGAKSVSDLFGICLQEGSLVASASALPLLPSRSQSRYSCLLLMTRAIEAFVYNTNSSDNRFDGTEEERSVMGDIFRFGIKLEDAIRFESTPDDDETEEESGNEQVFQRPVKPKVEQNDDADSVLSENASSSSASDFSEDSQSVADARNLLCSTDRQSLFAMFDNESREELEIRKSALSFIGGAEVPGVDFLSINDGEHTNREDDLDSNIICGVVGNALAELILSPKTDRPWKAMACVARMLAQNNCEDAIMIFNKVASSLTGAELDAMIPDLHPDLRAGDAMDRFTEFLVTETGHCGNEITDNDAGLILNLVLHFLQSLDGVYDSKEQPSFLPGLVMVGLVASSVAGREEQLLSTLRDDCFISECYKVTAYDC